MTTWEEIRDEVAGMLADGKPLEDVLAKLEQRKNEMAKANLLKVMDEMKNPKQMTNEDWLHSMNIEQLAEIITDIRDNDIYASNGVLEPLIFKLVGVKEKELRKKIMVDWLKQKYKGS